MIINDRFEKVLDVYALATDCDDAARLVALLVEHHARKLGVRVPVYMKTSGRWFRNWIAPLVLGEWAVGQMDLDAPVRFDFEGAVPEDRVESTVRVQPVAEGLRIVIEGWRSIQS